MSIHSEKSSMTGIAIACWIIILRDCIPASNMRHNQFFFSPCQIQEMENCGSILLNGEQITYQKEGPTVFYLPINDRGKHWILMVYDVENRWIYVYDPLEHEEGCHLKRARILGRAIDNALKVPNTGTRLLLS